MNTTHHKLPCPRFCLSYFKYGLGVESHNSTSESDYDLESLDDVKNVINRLYKGNYHRIPFDTDFFVLRDRETEKVWKWDPYVYWKISFPSPPGDRFIEYILTGKGKNSPYPRPGWVFAGRRLT